MKNYNTTRNKYNRIIATFFLIVFLPTLIPSSLYASNNGPIAPEATSFEPVDATDMVNLATGDMSYVLPLLNVPSPEGGYPLALSYHAGIAMNQEASWVGLGWNVNPGALSRNVNNSPDDWNNAKSIDFAYSNLGSHTKINVGVGVQYKLFSLAFDYTFIDGKGKGGIVSLGIGAPISKGVNAQLSGSVGFGIYSNYSSIGIGITSETGVKDINASGKISLSSLKDNLFGVDLAYAGQGLNYKNGSLGISFQNPLYNFIDARLKIGASTTTNVAPKLTKETTSNFSAAIPVGKFFNLKFSYDKSDYSMFDTQTSNINGVLYLKDSYNFSNVNNRNHKNYYMDSHQTQLPFSSISGLRGAENNTYSINPSYDNYYASGQGISLNIQPLLLESKTLVLSGINNPKVEVPASNGINGYSKGPFSISYHVGSQFSSKFMENSNPDTNKIHFYSLGSNTSYLYTNLINFNLQNNLNKITDLTNQSSVINHRGYDSGKNRLKKENFIETYTNEQIKNNNLLIIEAKGIDRNKAYSYAPKGIGAFKITTVDGKTYHYSLPVYNFEMISRSYRNDSGEDNNFIEKINTQPYAASWLLTAVTGPDYIDLNSNGSVDEYDYGYWVDFEYGKWTDSFVWKKESIDDKPIPSSGKENYNTSSRMIGVKEIYYLNSVNTRTHSALFIKNVRVDDHSKSYAKSAEFKQVNNSILNNPSLATGVYFENTNYRYNIKLSNNSKNLKLEKIVVINKKDKKLFSLTSQNSPENSTINSFDVTATGKIINVLGQDLGTQNVSLHQRTWNSGTFSGNVYLSNKISTQLLKDTSIKTIKFNYDNSLNKLTLNSVNFLGKNETSILPPYKFEYFKIRDSHKDNYDLWGFDKSYPHNFSLKNIKTPTGANIKMEYERDDFENVLENKKTIQDFTPDLTKFVNNGSSGSLEFKYNHPCYSIGEIFSFINVGKQFSIILKREGNTFETVATVNSINGNTVDVSFLSPIPSYYSGDFYKISRRGGTSEYSGRIIIPPFSDVRNELMGKCNDSRGGIRVKSITLQDEINDYITTYSYDDPKTGLSSGFTVSTPYVKNLNNVILSDGVYYEYVTVSSENLSNDYNEKQLFQFKVLNPKINFKNSIVEGSKIESAEYGDILKINVNESYSEKDILEDNQGSNKFPARTTFLKSEIIDNSSKLGVLISVSKLNNKNQVLEKIKYNYSDSFSEDIDGSYTENFLTYKSQRNYAYFTSSGNTAGTDKYEYWVNSSNIKVIPTTLISEEIESNNKKDTYYYDEYDFLTGQLLETRFFSSDGKIFRTRLIPAYTKYTAMGSKVDNINYKNMLSQNTAEYSYIYDELDAIKRPWKVTGVGITTWNNEWSYQDIEGNVTTPTLDKEKVWRKHKTYVWNGAKDDQGIFLSYNISYDDGFDWTVGVGSQRKEWKQISEVTLYDHFSMALEAKDINGNKAATKMGDNNTKIVATGNAGYNEMFYSGGENKYSEDRWFDASINVRSAIPKTGFATSEIVNSAYSHTGKNSIALTPVAKFGVDMKSGQHRAGKYKLSVWVEKSTAVNAILKVNDNDKAFISDNIVAGNWILKTAIIDVPVGDCAVYLYCANGAKVYYDDFMLRPVASSITGYAYNEFDELTHIIGNNGLATRFEYDAAGRLTKTYVEVVDDPANGLTGGFKLKSENKIRYKTN
jgi:YD repeat-containing protein